MNGRLAFGNAEADDEVDVLALPEPTFETSDEAAAVLGAVDPGITGPGPIDRAGSGLKTSGAVDAISGSTDRVEQMTGLNKDGVCVRKPAGSKHWLLEEVERAKIGLHQNNARKRARRDNPSFNGQGLSKMAAPPGDMRRLSGIFEADDHRISPAEGGVFREDGT